MRSYRKICLITAICYLCQTVVGTVGYLSMKETISGALEAEDKDLSVALGVIGLSLVMLMLAAYAGLCLFAMLLKLLQLRRPSKLPSVLCILFDVPIALLLLQSLMTQPGVPWHFLVYFALHVTALVTNGMALSRMPTDAPTAVEGETNGST